MQQLFNKGDMYIHTCTKHGDGDARLLDRQKQQEKANKLATCREAMSGFDT